VELQSVKQRFGIIGNSPGINYALEVVLRVAPTNLTVLITGESGVGKEIFSQIIHQYSARKHEPFIAVNCGAIPEGTIDSELFGHEKGSFTGASDSRKGYFETVNGGTIFLDEIGEMPLGTQARMLRMLESGEFIRVGSSKPQKTDVRVVAATNVDLPHLIERGRFREDLYYRLNTVPILVPPLRERSEDIYLLFRKFAVDFAERYRMPAVVLDNDARRILEQYPWPGNVRELKNMAEKISVLAKEKVVSGEDLQRLLPQVSKRNLPILASEAKTGSGSLDEREILYKVLFEMRRDINDLKRFVFQLAQGEESINPADLHLPANLLPEESLGGSGLPVPSSAKEPSSASREAPSTASSGPIVIESDAYEEDSVEESLSIADKEKELIQRALQKHKGKRKDAALDLGISERTLYRKIKEYVISE
jgi:transcriptional regulator with PAS, ATPase and Fis domain